MRRWELSGRPIFQRRGPKGWSRNEDLRIPRNLTAKLIIGKMLVPLGWYPSCLTPQGAL